MLLCTACCEALGPANWPGCPRCGALEDADWATSAAGCPACRNVKLHFQRVIPLGPYDGAFRDAVPEDQAILSMTTCRWPWASCSCGGESGN